VRNHIKVEQQLKLHIEVLQEKLDDIEKEKEEITKEFEKEKGMLEKTLKR
jgi:chaperonin cofactor prefoldin